MDELTAFLLARIDDDKAAAWVDAFGDLPDTPEAKAAAAGTLAWQLTEMHYAVRRLGVTTTAALGGLGRSKLQQWARAYAGHPDYRDEWSS